MFSCEKAHWEIDGRFFVMNADFALAKDNTTRDAYRNMFMRLYPELYRQPHDTGPRSKGDPFLRKRSCDC